MGGIGEFIILLYFNASAAAAARQDPSQGRARQRKPREKERKKKKDEKSRPPTPLHAHAPSLHRPALARPYKDILMHSRHFFPLPRRPFIFIFCSRKRARDPNDESGHG